MVVKNVVGPQGLDILKVGGRACGNDTEIGLLGELDSNNSSSGAASVNEEWKWFTGRGYGLREMK